METVINGDKNNNGKYKVIVVKDCPEIISLDDILDDFNERRNNLIYDKCMFGYINVRNATRIIAIIYLIICTVSLWALYITEKISNLPKEYDSHSLIVNPSTNNVSKTALDIYCTIVLSSYDSWKLEITTVYYLIEAMLSLSVCLNYFLLLATYSYSKKAVCLWFWHMLIYNVVLCLSSPDIVPCLLPINDVKYFNYTSIISLFINVINIYTMAIVGIFHANECELK